MTKNLESFELLGFHLIMVNKEMKQIIQPFLINKLQPSAYK